jgi:hypothetical protein
MSYNAVYNSRNLGTNGYYIYKIEVGMPKTIVNKYGLVQSDGNIVTGRYYGERKITVSGRIEATSLDDMQSKLDTLKTYTVGYEKELDITIGTTVRRYTATVSSFSYDTSGYLCEWDIDFTCDSIAEDANSSSLVFGTYTSSGTSYANAIGGTYFAEPSLDFTINQIDPYWSSKYIDIRNAVTNQRMRFTRTWKWGDRVVVNGRTKNAVIYPSSTTIISNADSLTGWTGTATLSLETALMKEGVACLKIAMAVPNVTCSFIRLNSSIPIDLSTSVGTVIIPVFIPTPTAGTVQSVKLFAGSNATLGTNYRDFTRTTQWDGSALAMNAWNYIAVGTSTGYADTGTPVMTSIISIQVTIRGTAGTMQLNGALLDYISLYKQTTVAVPLDYEGVIPDMDIGSTSLIVSDELTSRNITIAGSYYKRYL